MRYDLSKPSLLGAGIALTLAALVGLELLPARTLELTRPGGVSNLFLTTPGEDHAEAPVQWLDAEHLHWRCHYTAIEKYQPCGLTLVLSGDDPTRGRDLTRFDTLEMDLVYKGPAPFVRVAIRNFDPRFSKVEDGNSARMHSVNLRPRDVEKPVRIDLSELTVPEWWIHQFNLAREYNRPSLENATALTIDLPADLSGQVHELQLRSLVLKGDWISRDRVYLGILCSWLLGASLVVLRGWQQLRRSNRLQQREIDALMVRTRQLRIEQEQLRRQATIDELTGVLNRRGLEGALDDLEAQAEPLGLVLLDIDHFKQINDHWGHASGDEVLRRVAAVVAANLRASDIVGRWGGEEFLVACRCRHIDEAAALAEKLRAAVAATHVDSKGRFSITASFGVTLVPPGAAMHRAFRRADAALYRAKESGRNRVERSAGQDAATTV
ncbi:diguanylate cyclase (GGDEF)-like protein [Pelomonas saccharophila]|uniref:diguanylate cyclase n=1 Tax=Roseateles saccharophilus TaxID=304 RepID=A0ABU1YQU3_ROSSA|nr:diguanylate cyclase [Roseateles saccharophilus]MDR7271231.1 diguanylate cyclase (GGDEF)-like protein [Roseateles saccharophilus]